MPTRVVNLEGRGFGREEETGKFLTRKEVAFKDDEFHEEDEEIKGLGFVMMNNNDVCNDISGCWDEEAESSSSIGKNSDLCADPAENNSMENIKSGCGEEEEEVQSSYNNNALDAMEALEQVLPMRRGISGFYNGKSKSFTSLADADTWTSSIKDIAKPDNPYTRRRRNVLACNFTFKNYHHKMRTRTRTRPTKRSSTAQTTLALVLAMTTDSNNNNQAVAGSSYSSSSSSSSPWRSLSLAGLHQCASAAAAPPCTESSNQLQS